MIRFCDRAVGCVEYDSLSIKELQEYFLSGNEDDVLCIYDDFSTMRYAGMITYDSFRHSININSAIRDEYVIWGSDMWQTARKYFADRSDKVLLPVLNQEYQLICFAYEDMDANREIRMLRELTETSEALQFRDVYPEYKCVKIYEFNELAYFFAKYLKSQDIVVQVDGVLWQGFFDGEECQTSDYECMPIYAEGIGEKKRNWRENLLRSVSVEFECIDKIYETNIKEGLIQNAEGDCNDLLERLKSEKEIIVLGTGWREQDAYDFLAGNGIDICCFTSVNQDEQEHMIFGKKIISEAEAWHMYHNPVFIECNVKNSAWGMGNVDYYDYMGYLRNRKYILLRDYVEIPENNLLNLLKSTQVVLLGDIYLCSRLYDYLKTKAVPVIGYLRVLSENIELKRMPEACIEELNEESLCLIVEPQYCVIASEREIWQKKKEHLIEYARKNRINNYTDYFSNMISFINIEADKSVKYTKTWLMPSRIVLGSIESRNGNIFFRGLLDGHPSIALMCYSVLNNNLFWICVCLSMVEADEILPLLWKMIEGSDSIFNPTAFNEKMSELLSYDSKFTSEELFVMIHIAYMYMCGRNIKEDDIRNIVIYWEPHFLERLIMEDYTKWLGTEGVSCDIINVVRNICMHHGSRVRLAKANGIETRKICNYVLVYPTIEKKNHRHSDRLVMKFEDLKCRPKEMLEIICNKWGIPWSDTLLRTTCCGEGQSWNNGVEEIKNFDLEPVYNTYEEFFSEYDRFRMVLISAPWQRKYGYPYVEVTQFSRRELQEMFSVRFRFEEVSDDESYRKQLDDKIALQARIRYRLQKVRMLEFYNELL